MNWTGGRLQRHSKHTSSAIRNRQRQHFAKVRAHPPQTSFNASCPPSPRPTGHGGGLLNCGNETAFPDGPTLGSTVRMNHSNGSHGNRKRLWRTIEGQGTKRKSNADMQLLSSDTEGFEHEDGGDPILHRRKSRRTESYDATSRRHETAESLESQPRGKGREQDIETQKARLLEKMDWAGLNRACPATDNLSFAKAKGTITRKKPIHPTRPVFAVQSNERVAPQTTNRDGDQREKQEKFMSGAILVDPEKIKVRIGYDSISNRSLKTANDSQLSASSSNIMLFDLDNMASNETQRTPSDQFSPLIRSIRHSRDGSPALYEVNEGIRRRSSPEEDAQQRGVDVRCKTSIARGDQEANETEHISSTARLIRSSSSSTSTTRPSCQVYRKQTCVSSLEPNCDENVVFRRSSNAAADSQDDWTGSPSPCIGRYLSTGPNRWFSGSEVGSRSALNFRSESHDIMQLSVSETERDDHDVGRRGSTAVRNDGPDDVSPDGCQRPGTPAMSPVVGKSGSEELWEKFVFGDGTTTPPDMAFEAEHDMEAAHNDRSAVAGKSPQSSMQVHLAICEACCT